MSTLFLAIGGVLLRMCFCSYEMYTGDRSASTELEPPKTPEDGMPEIEDGQALEVIELANGETIWYVPP